MLIIQQLHELEQKKHNFPTIFEIFSNIGLYDLCEGNASSDTEQEKYCLIKKINNFGT